MLCRPDLSTTDIVHGYCRFMIASGYPVCRVNLALTTLHPQMQALRYVWYDDVRDPGPFPSPALFHRSVTHPDGCTIDEAMMSHGARHTEAYQKSPFYQLQHGATKLSFRLTPGTQHEYGVLDDLAGLRQT